MFFKDVIGQESVKTHLIDTVKNNRISHAQLFLGQQGTGGLALALAYSRYILCENKQDTDACGECPSCVRVNTNNHPDLHFSFPVILNKSKHVEVSDDVIEDFRNTVLTNPYITTQEWYKELGGENKQGIIAVKESASISHKLSLKSFEGGYKIMLVWMLETMNVQTANKLLKIIEEPPPKTLFLFVAENHEQMLPTILSRAQTVKLKPLHPKEISAALVSREDVDASTASELALLSEGNYSRAVSILHTRTEENINFNLFSDWMRLSYKRDVPAAYGWVDEIAVLGREGQKTFLRYCLHIFRNCIIQNYGVTGIVHLSGNELTFAKKFGPFINHKNILELNELFNSTHYDIERNGNAKIIFLDLSFKIFRLLKEGAAA